MNTREAIKILELPESWDETDLKKNYRRLAMKYHPDKCGDSTGTEFKRINEAYEFLQNPVQNSASFPFGPDINEILKSFAGSVFKFNFSKKIQKVEITPLEFFTGVNKEVRIPEECNCTENICLKCSGCGYSTKNIFKMDSCLDCLGEGIIKKCKCENYTSINVVVGPKPKLNSGPIKIKIGDPKYLFQEGNLYYHFDISLKDSLIGFKKTFKDPFGKEHVMNIRNTVISQNDGYNIYLENGESITLVFNVIMPKKISKQTIKILTDLDL